MAKQGVQIIERDDVMQFIELNKLQGKTFSYKQARCELYREWCGRAKTKQATSGQIDWEYNVRDYRDSRGQALVDIRDAIASLPADIREKANKWLAGEMSRAEGCYNLPRQLRNNFSVLFGVE